MTTPTSTEPRDEQVPRPRRRRKLKPTNDEKECGKRLLSWLQASAPKSGRQPGKRDRDSQGNQKCEKVDDKCSTHGLKLTRCVKGQLKLTEMGEGRDRVARATRSISWQCDFGGAPGVWQNDPVRGESGLYSTRGLDSTPTKINRISQSCRKRPLSKL